MRFPTAVTFALTVLLVASTPGAVAAAPPAVSPSVDDRPSPRYALDDPVPLEPGDPAQVIRIGVTDEGDADWTIQTRFRLESDDDVDTFTAYADEVTSGQRATGYDVTTFRRFASEAEQSTGREMEITDARWNDPRIVRDGDDVSADDVSADEPATGVVSYSVRWTNFALVDGNRLRFGDALAAEDGTRLPGLTSDQRLVIESPNNYGFASPPAGGYTSREDGALVWDGPHEFREGELEIVFLRGAGPWWWIVISLSSIAGNTGAALLLVLALAGAGYLLVRRRPDLPVEVPDSPLGWLTRSADGGPDDADDATSVDYAEDDAVAADAAADDGDGDDEVDVDLLSDEERVERLLRQNGGRMKQAAIVTETGWSNAKVSQLLSKMDDEGQINKLRIGRENLITLPDVDLTEIG